MPDRPKLVHERLADALRADLDFALTADLSSMDWRELAQMRQGLFASMQLQLVAGPIATSEQWQAALDRLQARMNVLYPAGAMSRKRKR